MMASLNTAVSGMRAAQVGLSVTGHNMGNSQVPGFSRQRADQRDFFSLNRGQNAFGPMQVGLGTDVAGVRQIRDMFLDIEFRDQNSKLSFHSQLLMTGREIELILGELQSDYRMQSVINDMWDALNELNVHLPGLETRANFIATSFAFLQKSNNIYSRLMAYTHNLDNQIRDGVGRINFLLEQIHYLNDRISGREAAGDRANDYRDMRNRALDELSTWLDISFEERPNGKVMVWTTGADLVSEGMAQSLGLRFTDATHGLVEPIFSTSREILPYDESHWPVFNFRPGWPNPLGESDRGKLLGLITSRGLYPANHTTVPMTPPPLPALTAASAPIDFINGLNAFLDAITHAQNHGGMVASNLANMVPLINSIIAGAEALEAGAPLADFPDVAALFAAFEDLEAMLVVANANYLRARWNVEDAFIPRVQREFDTLFNAIVTTINDIISPQVQDPLNAPLDLRGDAQWEPIFVRRHPPIGQAHPRYDADGNFWEPDPNDWHSLYTIGNLMINPLFSDTAGFSMIALSRSGDVEDINLVQEIMDAWSTSSIFMTPGGLPLNINAAYRHLVNGVGIKTSEAANFVREQSGLVNEIENRRQAIMGVSIDEELGNMLVFQHAFNASARVLNLVDSMIDTIVNRTGRVGI